MVNSILNCIPDELRNMTLNELFDFDSNDDAIYQKRNNKISMKVIKDDIVFSLSIDHIHIDINNMRSKTSKEELIGEILKLRKQGMMQRDIADILNVSQSYVSALLKGYNLAENYSKEDK